MSQLSLQSLASDLTQDNRSTGTRYGVLGLFAVQSNLSLYLFTFISPDPVTTGFYWEACINPTVINEPDFNDVSPRAQGWLGNDTVTVSANADSKIGGFCMAAENLILRGRFILRQGDKLILVFTPLSMNMKPFTALNWVEPQ